MAQAPLAMHVRKVGSKAAIIDIEGDLTASGDSALTDAYTQSTDAGAKAIILNFEKLEYMNSSGIGLLVTLLIRVNRNKQRLFTFGLSDHYKQIFELTRLNDAIHVYESEREALDSADAL